MAGSYFDFANTPIEKDTTLKAKWCCAGDDDEPFVDRPLASGYGEIEYLDDNGNIQKIAATSAFFSRTKQYAFNFQSGVATIATINGVNITSKNLVSYTLGESCKFAQSDYFFSVTSIVMEQLVAVYGISSLKKSQLFIGDGKTLLGPSQMLVGDGPQQFPKLNMGIVFPMGIWSNTTTPLEYWEWYSNGVSMPSEPTLESGKVITSISWPDYNFSLASSYPMANIIYSGSKIVLPENLKMVARGAMGGWYAPNLTEIEVNANPSSWETSSPTYNYPAPFTFRGSPAAASIKITGTYATQFVTKYPKSYFYL